VAALAFGPIHNITTKTLVLVAPGQEEKGVLGKALDRVRAILGRKKKEEEEEEKKDSEDKKEEDVEEVEVEDKDEQEEESKKDK